MRLSTSFIYSLNKQAILGNQNQVSRVGQQLATGQRVVTPSDDPISAAKAVKVSQSQAVNDQFADVRTTARRQLSIETNALQQVNDTIGAVKQRLVQAGNGALSDDNRESLADQLDGLYKQLKTDANTTDANGNYIFSGFDNDSPAVDSNNDLIAATNTRSLKVSASREISVQDTAKSVFKSFTSGARYVGQANDGNSGGATFKNIDLTENSATKYGQSFQIDFGNDPSTYNVNVVDSNGNVTSLATGQNYTPGDRIDLGNVGSVEIHGTPDSNDAFTFRQSNADASNFGTTDNLIQTVKKAADALRQGGATPSDRANLENTLSTARVTLDNGMNNVLSVQASVGTRLNALDTLDSVGDSRDLTYSKNLSRLQDVNAASAISDYAQAKLALQFSEKTFQDVNKLSLFSLRS